MKILRSLAVVVIILSVVAVTTLAPLIAPNGEWWEACLPDPTCATQYPPQPTFTPRPTPTCRPTTTCPPNPSPTSYPTATFYPTQPAIRPTQTPTTRVGIVHGSGDFETGDLAGFYAAGNTPEVVSTDHPVRAGDHSMRAYVHRTESGCTYRTEVYTQADDTTPPGSPNNDFYFNNHDEYWIGFSIYVQADLVSDPPGLSDVVYQFQAAPDPGENYRQPCVALTIDTLEREGQLVNYWRIWRLWDTRAFSPGTDWEHASWFEMALLMDEADIGGWTDWVFRVVWDWTSDGLLQVWRNGELVLDVSGGNCANNQRGPFTSFGIYKWSYDDPYEHNSEWRLFYFDEFRIGDANATYEDVAPNGGH